jgi:alpha-tubulin suppressor-like RCC1 family protein
MAVHGWGLNTCGELGPLPAARGREKVLVPRRLAAAAGPVVGVGCGGHWTLLLTADGAVVSLGRGQHGRLGGGEAEDRAAPGPVHLPERAMAVAAGARHGAALGESGAVYQWGHARAVGAAAHLAAPRRVEGLGPVRAVAAGGGLTLALAEDGAVYSWGAGPLGRQGKANQAWGQVAGLPPAVAVSAGALHCAAITETGDAWVWGAAAGWGARGVQAEPAPLQGPGGRVAGVSCSLGEHHPHTLLLGEDGGVLACGDGYKGKLGLGAGGGGPVPPTPVPGLDGVVAVVAGGIHSAALDRQGNVWTWGCGSDGRLGHPEAEGHRYLFK